MNKEAHRTNYIILCGCAVATMIMSIGDDFLGIW